MIIMTLKIYFVKKKKVYSRCFWSPFGGVLSAELSNCGLFGHDARQSIDRQKKSKQTFSSITIDLILVK